MILYYGPGDVRAIFADHHAIAAQLSTIDLAVGTSFEETAGLGVKWDRFTPIGVRKGTCTQDGWMPAEVRHLFRERNQLKARQLMVMPTGGAGHEAMVLTGDVAATIDVGQSRSELVGATITWGVSGEVIDDLITAGYVDRLESLLIDGDRDPVAGSTSVLAAATVGAASTAGGKLYAVVGEANLTLHRLLVALTDDEDMPAAAFRAQHVFAAAGYTDVEISGAIPASLFTVTRFVPAFRMRFSGPGGSGATTVSWSREMQWLTAATATAGATSMSIDQGADSFAETPDVGSGFTVAGSTVQHRVVAKTPNKAAASTTAVTLHFAPGLETAVANNTALFAGYDIQGRKFAVDDKVKIAGNVHTVTAVAGFSFTISPGLAAPAATGTVVTPDDSGLSASDIAAALRRT